jgi:hypothetical protein
MHGIASLQHVQKIKSYVGLLQGYEKQKTNTYKAYKEHGLGLFKLLCM